MTRIETVLPSGLACYRQTPRFSMDNVPQALLSSHSVKSGVWGLLCVVKGRVRYCLDIGNAASLLVPAGGVAVIAPGVPHHVELMDPDSTFFIEFHRPEASA